MSNDVGRLMCGELLLTRADVERHALALSDRLSRLGVRPGHRIVLQAGNSPEFVIALLALIHMDTSLVLLDLSVSERERRRVTAMSSAEWLLYDRDRSGPTGEQPGPLVSTPAEGTLTRLPLGDLVDCGASPPAVEAGNEGAGLSFDNWRRRRDALIIWSSGSTGDSKGIVRSGASMFDNLERTRERMGYRASDVLLPLLPFSHQYGLSMVLLWWLRGMGLVISSGSRVDRVVETIIRRGVTVVDSTPPVLHSLLRILDTRGLGADQLASVRMWCSGGAPLGHILAERFREVFGRPVLDGYGSSETGNIALASEEAPVGCGRPLPGVTVEVIDAEGAPVPTGVRGEIVVGTPDLMTGVLGADGQIHEAPAGRFRIKDIGFLDEDGCLTVLGRKAAVHRMGYTIYPESLAQRVSDERCEVQILAFERAQTGSELVFVVADPDGRDQRYWRRRFIDRLEPHEYPNRVLVVDELPLNRNGKVDMAALRDLARPAPATAAVRAANDDGPAVTAPDTPFTDRWANVMSLIDHLETERARIRSILTEVMHWTAAESEIDSSLHTLRGAADEMRRGRPRAVSEAAVFMPSNIPLYGYVLYCVIPSLYAGRIHFRPSQRIARVTRALHQELSARHRLPIGECDVSQRAFLTGPVRRSELVVFTGAYENAERIRRRLDEEQLFLYFGSGVNPFVVGADANLETAVDDLVRIRMYNTGQDCFAPDLVLVDDRVADTFLELLCGRVSALRHGDNTETASDYGSMYYEEAFTSAFQYLHNNARHILVGGEASITDRHLRPTVLDIPLPPKGEVDEMFAPIFNVSRFSDEAEALGVLGSSHFSERSMGAMVYGVSEEITRFLHKRHTVCEERTLLDADEGNRPFGGRGIVANYAAVGGRRVAEPLLVSQAVADHLGQAVGTSGLTLASADTERKG
ncbi:aldehyde dehydrogenase family protein [Nocardiopsis terrae]